MCQASSRQSIPGILSSVFHLCIFFLWWYFQGSLLSDLPLLHFLDVGPLNRGEASLKIDGIIHCTRIWLWHNSCSIDPLQQPRQSKKLCFSCKGCKLSAKKISRWQEHQVLPGQLLPSMEPAWDPRGILGERREVFIVADSPKVFKDVFKHLHEE